MRDIERAKALLQTEDCSCVLVKGDIIYTSRKAGIAPLVEFLSSGAGLNGFSAADKIVGKAAVLAEGDAAKRKDIIFLEELPLFFK